MHGKRKAQAKSPAAGKREEVLSPEQGHYSVGSHVLLNNPAETLEAVGGRCIRVLLFDLATI